MIGSLYSGLTGLMGYQYAVDVTGNNIANQGTIAFKYSRTSFSSLFAENRYYASNQGNVPGKYSLTGWSNRAGLGTSISSIDTIMSTGIIENTDVSSDVAIGGEGFFIVGGGPDRGNDSFSEKIYLSRVGNFQKNMFPDLIQAGTGLSLYGYLGKDDGNGNIVIGDIPTEEEMKKATQQEKLDYLKNLTPMTLEDLQEISSKKTEAVDFSGILNAQVGPTEKVKIEGFDNTGDSYDILLQFSRDYAMLNQDLGRDYEAYEMSIVIKNEAGEVIESTPNVTGVVFSPSGDLLTDSGEIMNNLTLNLPNNRIITVEKGEILGNVDYISPEVTTYADIFGSYGLKDKLPFIFEKIKVGEWNLKPDLQDDGNIQSISLKGESGTYLLSTKGEGEIETNGVRILFDYSGNVESYAIVDPDGNIIDTMKSFVFEYSEDNTIEVAWESENLVQSALTSDVTATQKEGREPGSLTGIQFSSSGYLLGNYSNGEQLRLGFIPLATLRSTEALNHTSSNPLLYEIPITNGALDENFYGLYKPGRGLTGNLIPSALEISNVDISKEMVNLIKYQRAIQLNARTVQTADQILQQAIQLKG